MRRIYQSLLSLYKEQNGVSMILVALCIFMLIAFTALVVDVGGLYIEKSRLQKALDAAVLAGAHKLMLADSALSVSQAKTVAKDISQKNGYTLNDADIDAVHKTHIKATKQENVPLFFAKVIGINQATVSASAKAIVGPLTKGEGIAPIAVSADAVPHETRLTCKDEKNSPGNCGFLSVDGKGADELKKAIIDGSKYSVGSDVDLETKPGTMNGPISKAIDELIKSDKDKPHCQSPSTADNSCNRVIYVVIIKSWEDVTGRDTVEVIGLAAYWVEKYDDKGKNKSIIGHFMNTVTRGEIGDPGSGNGYGLYGVKLVE